VSDKVVRVRLTYAHVMLVVVLMQKWLLLLKEVLLLLLVVVAQNLPSNGHVVGVGTQSHAAQLDANQVTSAVGAVQLRVCWRAARTAAADAAER